jgi:hypothetical protein
MTEYDKINNQFVLIEDGKTSYFDEFGVCYKLVNGFIHILSYGNYEYVFENFQGNRKFFNTNSEEYKQIKIMKIFPEDCDIKDLEYLLATNYLPESYLCKFLVSKNVE